MDGFTAGLERGPGSVDVQETSSPRSRPDDAIDSSSDSLKDLGTLFTERSRFSQSIQLFRQTEVRDQEFLIDLARQATLLPNVLDRDVVQDVVFRRLDAMDPVKALARLNEFANQDTTHMIRAIFHEWLYADLEYAIESASAMKEPAKVAILKELLNSRYDLPESVLRDSAKKLDIERRFDPWWSEHREFAYVADPEQEWYKIVERNHESDSDEEELKRLAKKWIQ